MKQYCLTFKALSTITGIPDSQKLFGYVCNYFLNVKGEEAFQKYISSFDKEPLLIHSSMYISCTLPMVKESLFSSEYINKEIVKIDSSKQISYLQRMKQYKKINSMSEEIYKSYIEGNDIEKFRNDVIQNNVVKCENGILSLADETIQVHHTHSMNTHVRKLGFYMNEEDQNELYYNDDIYFDPNTTFTVYVKTNLSKEEVKDIFGYTHYFGLGIKHSVGKNSFQLIDVKETAFKSSKQKKLLLSKSGFDPHYDVENSSYSLNSRIYKTSNAYLNNRTVGRCNLFAEGSFMAVKEDKEWYGELLKEEVDGKPIYHYAIGFVF